MSNINLNLSNLEQQVLLAILRQRSAAYGVSISEEIDRRTGKTPSIGSVYSALERMEERGFVSSRRGEPTAERGGRAKLLFTLSALGESALQQSLCDLDKLRQGVKLGGRLIRGVSA